MPKKKLQKLRQAVESDSESDYDDEIQTFYKEQDKILLDSDHKESDDSDEEEVYGLDSSDSEDEDVVDMQQQLRQIKRNKIKKKLGSDLEDDTEDEALPDSRAWGSKKSWFVGGDVRDNKIVLLDEAGEEDKAGAAILEEKEMEEIEKRQLARMSEEDYMHPLLMKRKKTKEEKAEKISTKKAPEKRKKTQEEIAGKISTKKAPEGSMRDSDAEELEDSEKTKGKKKKKTETKKTKSSIEVGIDELERIQVQTDFSKLPKDAEFERFKEMHPEYIPLVKDFQSKMGEFQDRIIPLMGLVEEGKIQDVGANYVLMKYRIISNYLICGGFYIHFMAKKTPRIHHHPVMKRLLELQQHYSLLVHVDERMKEIVDKILELERQGKETEKGQTSAILSGAQVSTKRKKASNAKAEVPAAKRRKAEVRFEEEDADDSDGQLGDPDEAEDDNGDEQERRAITQQMEKNKGLVVYRKKELKNPRVKHRSKYRRALIRRKGQVRDFKPPKAAYSGEMTGIRAGIIRSRKLK